MQSKWQMQEMQWSFIMFNAKVIELFTDPNKSYFDRSSLHQWLLHFVDLFVGSEF